MASQVFLEVVVSADDPDRSGFDDDGLDDRAGPGRARLDGTVGEARDALLRKSFHDMGVDRRGLDQIGLGAFEGRPGEVSFRAELLNTCLRSGLAGIAASALDAAIEIAERLLGLDGFLLALSDALMH